MRLIVFLAAAAMTASFFLTWVEMPFAGPHLSPWLAVRQGMIDLSQTNSWQTYVFLGGFAAAALAALTRTGGLALLAGISPVVVIVSLIGRADELRREIGLPVQIDWSDLAATWDVLGDFLRLGLWAYLGGAVILLVAGLSMLSSKR